MQTSSGFVIYGIHSRKKVLSKSDYRKGVKSKMAAKDEKEMAVNDVVYITAVICLLKVLNVVIFTGTMS